MCITTWASLRPQRKHPSAEKRPAYRPLLAASHWMAKKGLNGQKSPSRGQVRVWWRTWWVAGLHLVSRTQPKGCLFPGPWKSWFANRAGPKVSSSWTPQTQPAWSQFSFLRELWEQWGRKRVCFMKAFKGVFSNTDQHYCSDLAFSSRQILLRASSWITSRGQQTTCILFQQRKVKEEKGEKKKEFKKRLPKSRDLFQSQFYVHDAKPHPFLRASPHIPQQTPWADSPGQAGTTLAQTHAQLPQVEKELVMSKTHHSKPQKKKRTRNMW